MRHSSLYYNEDMLKDLSRRFFDDLGISELYDKTEIIINPKEGKWRSSLRGKVYSGGYMWGDPFGNYNIVIYAGYTDFATIMWRIAHEVKHIHQYHTGMLITQDGATVWNNARTVDASRYNDNPEEIDANTYANLWTYRVKRERVLTSGVRTSTIYSVSKKS